MNGLFSDPRFMIGMGLLSSNQPSFTPQNPMQNIMQNMMAGQQMKRQLKQDDLRQQQIDLETRYKNAQIESLMAPKDKGTKLVGNELIDLNTMKPVYTSEPEGKETSAMANAEALGLMPGTESYNDYIRSVTASKGTNVTNKIDIPGNAQITGDYVVTIDPLTNKPIMTVIPGSETDTKNKVLKEKQGMSAEQSEKTAGLQVDTIVDAKNKIKESPALTAGFFGGMLSNFGGSEAKDVGELLKTVEANISFDYLQAMRASSPTGGALGQVSERELALLGATAGSLDQSQSSEQLLETLNRLDRQFLEVIHGKEAADKIFSEREKAAKEKIYTWNPETGLLE